MATIKIVLDERRENTSGKYPLLFRIAFGKKRRDISSGIKVEPQRFNKKKQQLLDDAKLNLELQNRRIEYQRKLNHLLVDAKANYTIDYIKDYLLEKPINKTTVSSFWLEQIDKLNKVGSTGNARTYKTALNVVSKHLNLNSDFQSISYKNILELESALYERGMTTNGVSVYMRTFKAIFNKAIDLDIVGLEYYPFRKYKIKKIKVAPRVLSVQELQAYFNLSIEKTSTYYYAWLIGKLIFMMRGINLRDLLLLNHTNIKNGRLIYRRAKTKKLYSIPILKEIEECMKLFTPNEISILGMFSEKDVSDKVAFETLFSQKRKVINSHLKKLSKLLKIEEPITTYVFRYSFSNVAKQIGYSKDLISESLGHTYGNATTSNYLEDFHQEDLDALTSAVIKVVYDNRKRFKNAWSYKDPDHVNL